MQALGTDLFLAGWFLTVVIKFSSTFLTGTARWLRVAAWTRPDLIAHSPAPGSPFLPPPRSCLEEYISATDSP